MNYRFRVDEGRLVLQVSVPQANYIANYQRDRQEWRDATVADIPVADPFRGAATSEPMMFISGDLRAKRGGLNESG